MSSAYLRKLIALLGDIARRGHSGALRLDASGGESAILRFSHGLVAAFRPPATATLPGANATDAVAALRLRILNGALEAALQPGAAPEFEPAAGDGPALPAVAGAGALNAADLAIDLCRKIDDLSWLEESIREGRAATFRAASPPPAVQPHAALGAAEGFLLSRADGALTIQQVLDTSPLGESETLRALAALRLVGMLAGQEDKAQVVTAAGSAGVTLPHAPAKSNRMSDLDRFLRKTAVAAGPPAASPPGHTSEQQKERDALMQRCQEVLGQNHYSVLGVERSADEQMIRHAYYRLARSYHPDRLVKPHLEDIHRDLEAMFAVFTEAYNTLTDPAARAEYDRETSERAPGRRRESGLDKHAAARDSYLRGRKEMEAGKYFEAMRLFENATENDGGRAEYFHYLALCQGQNPRWRKKAEENFHKAIELNPGAAQSYLELARLYHKGGLERRSHEMYEQVLSWDASNEEALIALGRVPARGAEVPSTGILRSLFKKD
ncbi:MAG TPA: J domain-containing protein [Candidatus Polarisedimenticolia bacterium]